MLELILILDAHASQLPEQPLVFMEKVVLTPLGDYLKAQGAVTPAWYPLTISSLGPPCQECESAVLPVVKLLLWVQEQLFSAPESMIPSAEVCVKVAALKQAYTTRIISGVTLKATYPVLGSCTRKPKAFSR